MSEDVIFIRSTEILPQIQQFPGASRRVTETILKYQESRRRDSIGVLFKNRGANAIIRFAEKSAVLR